MSVYITLGTPGSLDFTSFSEATRKLLDLLSPLVALRHSNSPIARDISVQVAGFMGAIRRGVKASQLGFTTAEDLLALSGMVKSSTRAERAEYLMGTLKLANEAYTEGKEAYQGFTGVRRKIFGLIDQYTASLQNVGTTAKMGNRAQAQNESMRRSVEAFRRAVDVLEKFGQNVSALAQWWDWIQVETNARPSAQNTVVFDDSSLSDRTVLERWACLRTQFADYTNMVAQLEDTYPELFSMPPDYVPSNHGHEDRVAFPTSHYDLRHIIRNNEERPVQLRLKDQDVDSESDRHGRSCCIIA
ncbi:hypothetical protein D9613_002354 [Agrocybe pediades]|uniref:Uncharacterized protein n=1 Tax=Agrocybe pediades TaxID=84607 RepID=A0A8H4R558_9AGAR|nr:hypothetical protein D9613_002354 [Agrocybe pediades]